MVNISQTTVVHSFIARYVAWELRGICVALYYLVKCKPCYVNDSAINQAYDK